MRWIKTALLVLALSFSARAQDQIWTAYTPVTPDANGSGGAVEIGVQFSSDVAGTVTAIRFYKSAADTGTHTGTIWSPSGAALSTVTFSAETASGWQQMNLSTPVPIVANTTYTASYYTTVDHYAADDNFSWPVYNAPLHGLAGTYVYGGGGEVPTSVWMGTNYAVDIVFTPVSAPSLSSIAVTPTSPSIPAGATQLFTAIGTYGDSSTQNITSQVSWASSSTTTATISPGGLATGVAAGSSNVTASLSGIASPAVVLTVTAGSATCTCTPQVVLSWNAATGATSYNVYKGSVSGGPYVLVATVQAPNLNYLDKFVSNGNTYYYVTTPVVGGVESGYSTELAVTIPTP